MRERNNADNRHAPPPPLMVTGFNLDDRTAQRPPTTKGPSSTVVAFGRGQSAASIVVRKKAEQAAKQRATAPSLRTALPAPPAATPVRQMHRSGSVGQLGTNNGRAPQCHCRDSATCKCDMAFLEGVYVQNLQTQIEVLELENAYLRGSAERGALFAKPPTTATAEAVTHRGRHGVTSSSSKMTTTGSSLRRHSANAMRGGTSEESELEEERVRKDCTSSPRRSARPSESVQTKRVGFNVVEDERAEAEEWREREWQRESTEVELELERRAAREREAGWREAVDRGRGEREELEHRLRTVEGRASAERRSLMTENAELQRRLDELTPLLAEKEANTLRLEEELEAANGRLRASTKQLSGLQNSLEERNRESQQQESERERGLQRLKRQLEDSERELETIRAREGTLNTELDRLQLRLDEEKALVQRETSMRQRAHEERERAEEEAQQLQSKLDRLERERASVNAQLQEAHQNGELLADELAVCKERLAAEEQTARTLGAKLKERQHEEEHRSARGRLQRELEALQGLSNSLANENKGLREERAALEERTAELRQRLHARDGRAQKVAELLAEFLEKYRQSAYRVRNHLGRQSEDCEQFEQIVHKVRQLSASPVLSPPSAALRPSTTTSLSSSPHSHSQQQKSGTARRPQRTKTD